MKRIVLTLALLLGITSEALAGTGRAYVPISACKVGGTANFFGTGTAGTDSNGAPYITLASASEQFLTCEFWMPGSNTTTQIAIMPMMEAAAGFGCGNIYTGCSYEVTTPGSGTSDWLTNNAADATPGATQAAVSGSSNNRLFTNATSPSSCVAYDQGAGAACSGTACSNYPGRFRVTRGNTGCSVDVKYRGFYVYWTTA